MSDWDDDDKAAARRKPGPFESEMDSFDDDEFGGPLFGATTEQPAVGFDDDPGHASISPSSVNRSSTRSLTCGGTERLAHASASWARVRGPCVSCRRTMRRATSSGSASALT